MRRSHWILSGVGVIFAIFAVVLVFQFGGGSTVDGSGTGGAPAATATSAADSNAGADGKANGATNDQTGKPGENK